MRETRFARFHSNGRSKMIPEAESSPFISGYQSRIQAESPNKRSQYPSPHHAMPILPFINSYALPNIPVKISGRMKLQQPNPFSIQNFRDSPLVRTKSNFALEPQIPANYMMNNNLYQRARNQVIEKREKPTHHRILSLGSMNAFPSTTGNNFEFIQNDIISGNRIEEPVSYTHLTLPTIYSV
eukprot:TRINITY_DN4439_c0_g2_i1.p1 TRINITY_DN4439_c0_g2~~TRINITY_DN4439_c0_g2_i1.p1  ORF type:complete len:183 (-),score=18.04 TRINITY_DN4439_c0_g2_i1:34-582(-)